MTWRRAAVVLAAALAACAPADRGATPDGAAPGSGPPPAAQGALAPDVTLRLASGEDFVLSAEQKPVYLVFWAEW